jgi:uncharacterized protein (DUF1697 family)
VRPSGIRAQFSIVRYGLGAEFVGSPDVCAEARGAAIENIERSTTHPIRTAFPPGRVTMHYPNARYAGSSGQDLRLASAMKTYIALLRGINVGGNHPLPMKELRQVLEKNGCADVQTYVQSGNAVFRSAVANPADLAACVTSAVEKTRGFAPRVLVLTRSELERAAAGNPFPQADENPKNLHLFFLAERPKQPDLKAIESLKAGTEAFALKGKTFYLHTPDGFGTSKLAAKAARLLGVEATARNWRTVTALIQMAKDSSA